MKKSIFLFCIILASCFAHAQKDNDKVLFSIDGKPTYVSEFSRVYKKNLDLIQEDLQKDVNHYFDLFVEYKLKLTEAERLKLHEGKKYKNELAGYQKQLAKNYLTDKSVTEALTKEAYDRLQKEVNASHILIKIAEDASPEDTLKAYKEITKLRDRVQKGEAFETLAKQYSSDPSAKSNGGNLGYFSAFRMVYPFESGAFNTAVGEVSHPVRTQFGYHIIKVNNIRESRGEIQVSHILLFNPKNGEEKKEDPKEKIKEIYAQLQNGESFEKLAKRFSEDRSSAINGGKLPKFKSGKIRSQKFEDIAFSLENPGDLSEPFQSEFGWHIVQLNEKFPTKTYEEEKDALKKRIESDSRSKLITTSFVDNIKKNYSITENDAYINDFSTIINDAFFTKEWEKDSNWKLGNTTLFKIDDNKINYDAFLEYLINRRRAKKTQTKNYNALLKKHYNAFFNIKLMEHYENDLININDEYAQIYGEYRDGLLLFDLMEKQVWDKAKNDSLGLQTFYEAHKGDYRWKTRGDVIVASCSKASYAAQVKKHLEEGFAIEAIKLKLNIDGKVNVIFSSGVVEQGHRSLPEGYTFTKGVSEILNPQENDFVVVKVNEIIPATHKELEEIKGKVISDYQNELEKTWLASLKDKYEVKINKKVYKKLAKLNP